MAGGRGSRLGDLTGECPKPLVPVANRPVVGRLADLLRIAGIRDATVTLGYGASAVRDYLDNGAASGLRLTYSVEEVPMGTAGGVGLLRNSLGGTDPFLVLSADALTDFPLTEAVAFHVQRQAMVTMCAAEVDDPSRFGSLRTDEDGRVLVFAEKADRERAPGALVNTGIYVLDPAVFAFIPEGRPLDFGRELFPRLVSEGRPVFAFRPRGYWRDIGTPEDYLAGNWDVLEGRLRVPIDVEQVAPGIWVAADAQVDPGAILTAPVLVGPGSRVARGARLGPRTVIGRGCDVGAGARLVAAVLWDGAGVAAGGVVEHRVLVSPDRRPMGEPASVS